jgi:hypothetical protein
MQIGAKTAVDREELQFKKQVEGFKIGKEIADQSKPAKKGE